MNDASMLMERTQGARRARARVLDRPNLPYAVRQRVETVFEVLAHLPLNSRWPSSPTPARPSPSTRRCCGCSAARAPICRPDVVGVMPAWPERARSFRRDGDQVFEEHLPAPAATVWVRVSLGPLAERGEQRAMAYVLFISRPDVETVDHEEVRRLRKSLQLLADTQTDYVVEVDREAIMTFVSPSFCRPLGASERTSSASRSPARVLAADQAAVAAALAQALQPPFAGEMQARLAAEPGTVVDWQIDAVIGDGIVGLDLVGRPAAPGRRRRRHPRPARRRPPARRVDPRLAPIARALEALRPGDAAGLRRWRAPWATRPAPSASRTPCAAATPWRRRSAGAFRPA